MRAVIEYWFGASTDAAEAVADRDRLWWKADPAIDDDVRARFANCVEQAGRHELDDWAATAIRRQELILFTDQFPPHISRGTSGALSFTPTPGAPAHPRGARPVGPVRGQRWQRPHHRLVRQDPPGGRRCPPVVGTEGVAVTFDAGPPPDVGER